MANECIRLRGLPAELQVVTPASESESTGSLSATDSGALLYLKIVSFVV